MAPGSFARRVGGDGDKGTLATAQRLRMRFGDQPLSYVLHCSGQFRSRTALEGNLFLLQRGNALAHGPVARVVADAGATDIRGAFARLTKISLADTADEAA